MNTAPQLVLFTSRLALAQTRPDVSLVPDHRAKDAGAAGAPGQVGPPNIARDGLPATRSASSTFRRSPAPTNSLVRTTQLGLSRG
jgi:hypothetical protein